MKKFKIVKYDLFFAKLPPEFDGFKIAHVSDLHNYDYQERLVDAIRQQNPDIIVMTGDMIHTKEVEFSLKFCKNAPSIATTYYINGNHEYKILDTYLKFEDSIKNYGVNILNNKIEILEKGNAKISLIGLSDSLFLDVADKKLRYLEFKKNSAKLFSCVDTDFKILLVHKPELFNFYADQKIDLILSGHTHGGQVRLPFVGAIYTPNQKIFPKLSLGKKTYKDSKIIISGGLGNSNFVPRINNKPQLVIETLYKK